MSQLEHSDPKPATVTRPARIRFTCSACSFTANVGPDYAGKAIRCPNCSAPQLVDDPAKPVTATIATTAETVVTPEGVQFACSGCGHRTKLGREYLGQVISCPKCNAVRIVAADMGQTVGTIPAASSPSANRASAPAASTPPKPAAVRNRPVGARPVEFTCIFCGHQSRISPSTVGGSIYCPSCGEAQPLRSPPAVAFLKSLRADDRAAPPVAQAPVAAAADTPEVTIPSPLRGTAKPATAERSSPPPASTRPDTSTPTPSALPSAVAANRSSTRKAVNRKVMPANWDVVEGTAAVHHVGLGRRVITATAATLIHALVRISSILFAQVRAKNRTLARLRQHLAVEQQRRELAELAAASEARRRRETDQRMLLREPADARTALANAETQTVALTGAASADMADPITRSTSILDPRFAPTTQPRLKTSALEAAVATGILAVTPTIAEEAPPVAAATAIAPASERAAEPVTTSTTIHHFAPTTQPQMLASALETTVMEVTPPASSALAEARTPPSCGESGELFSSEAPAVSEMPLTKKRRKTTTKARRVSEAPAEAAVDAAVDAAKARSATSTSGRKSTSRAKRKKTE